MLINSNSERTYTFVHALMKSKVPSGTAYVVTTFNDGSAVISITTNNRHNATATVQILMSSIIDEVGDIVGYNVSSANRSERIEKIFDVGSIITSILTDLRVIQSKIR